MSKNSGLRVAITDSVIDGIEEHCFSEVNHEVGGFLIGKIEEKLTTISAFVASTKAQSHQTSLTFTHEAWDEVYQVMATDYPGENLVGWYHSHPGFGVFMSDYDSFIQQNFFASRGQVALVVDPLEGASAWFRWRDKSIEKLSTSKTRRDGLGGEAVDQVAGHVATKPGGRLSAFTPQTIVFGFVAALMLVLIGFFAGYSGRGNNDDSQTRLLFENESFRSSLLQNTTFVAKGDPKRTTFYVRYRLTNFELASGAWMEILRLRFGATQQELVKANPGMDFNTVPEVVVLPMKGWKTPPKAIAVVEPSPTTKGTPSPKPTQSTSGGTP